MSPARAGLLPSWPLGRPQGVDLDPLAPGRAAQELVVGVLDASLADDVAGPQARLRGPPQLVRRDLADEAEQVGRHRPVLVLADVGAVDAHPREPLPVLEQVEEQPSVDPLAQHDRVAGVLGRFADPAADRRLREAEQAAEAPELGPAGPGIARQVGGAHLQGHDRPVVDQDPAVAIEDLAARRMDADVEDAVVLSEGAVVLAVEHLDRPEAQQDGGDRRDHHGAENGYADVEAVAEAGRDVLGTLQEIHGRVSSVLS